MLIRDAGEFSSPQEGRLRIPEALETIQQAEALAESSEGGVPNCTGSELCFSRPWVPRRRKIEASFCTAIRIVKEQKSVSLAKAYCEIGCYFFALAGMRRSLFKAPRHGGEHSSRWFFRFFRGN